MIHMGRRPKSENQKVTDKKGADRMKRYEDNQGRKLADFATDETDDGLTCQIYWQKRDGGEWVECKYFYKKKEKS